MVDYSKKKIVIIGIGITGLSCVDFFLERRVIPRIMDTRLSPPGLENLPMNIDYYLGDLNRLWALESDIIVVSPGITLTHPILTEASKLGIEIIGDIELFCREAQKPIIAITGSNGKSTVATLIGDMARMAGWLVGVGGNIGLPALTLLQYPAELYILELSSFQLETTYSLKAQVATILNVKADHLNRYPIGMKQYCAAKLRIYKNASSCVFNAEDILTTPPINSGVNYISFGSNHGDYRLNQQQGNTWLCVKGRNILNTNCMKMFGQHNYINGLTSLALADIISIPRSCSIKVLVTFSGLPHRFQLVHEANGIRWINDSKSTNVDSTEAAIQSIKSNLKGTLWLLLGGDGKSANFKSLINYLQGDHVRVFCFGRDRNLLASLRPEISTCTKTLQSAMEKISIYAKEGDTVLLSPACASLDQFLNFEQRGKVFSQLAKKLG